MLLPALSARLRLGTRALPLRNRAGLVWRPGDPRRPTADVVCRVRGLLVLPGHDELAAGVESDRVPRGDPDVDDVPDDPDLGVVSGRRLLAVGQHPDLLRPDGDVLAVPLDDVRDPDEAGHEVRARSLVDL